MYKLLYPKLRFKEFGDDWQTFRLSNVAPFQRGFDLPVASIIHGEFPVVFSNGSVKLHNEFKVKGPGIITGRSGTVGKLHFVYKNYWPHNTTLWVTNFNGNDPKFIFYKYSTLNFEKYSTGSGVPTLNRNNLHHERISIPSLPEQQKIADFLSLVDAWIANLKKQKALLESYKKVMMQKIFTREIRFKDENGNDFPDWEEKRLGEVGEIKTSSVDKKNNINEKQVMLLNYMDVYRRDHIYSSDKFQKITAKDEQIKNSNLKLGDVLFTPSSEVPTDIGHSAVVMDNMPNVLYSYHLIRLRPEMEKFDHEFLGYAFKSFEFYKSLWRLAQGATRFTLSLESLKNVFIKFPKNLTEQRKIAKYFSFLDKLIYTKEKEVLKLENWKNGLMQQMFI